jgi:hypothetical protein
MVNVSTARKLSILARVAAQQAGRSRTAGAIFKGLQATAVHVGRVLHQLWLEVTGFVFLGLAGIGAFGTVHEYTLHQVGKAGWSRVLITLGFTLMCAWFGISSFWRAHKKR